MDNYERYLIAIITVIVVVLCTYMYYKQRASTERVCGIILFKDYMPRQTSVGYGFTTGGEGATLINTQREMCTLLVYQGDIAVDVEVPLPVFLSKEVGDSIWLQKSRINIFNQVSFTYSQH